MDAGISMGAATLRFQLSRRDLYRTLRITAWSRPYRKVAVPFLAGIVFLGQAWDGKYLDGVLWGAGIAFLYWAVSNGMLLAYAYLAGNETLMVPQEIELRDNRMIVTSEHSREEFLRPPTAGVKAAGAYLVLERENGGSLIFLRSSFADEADFEALANWAAMGE